MAGVKGFDARRSRRTSREAIVTAAAELVDREGSEALTMRRLADECGLSAMGIYRYIRDRDELLDLVVEHILEELPQLELRGTWERKAVAIFRAFRSMALRHPGVTALGVARVTPVPAMARFTARALAVLNDGGLRAANAVMTYDAMLMFTIGSILWQQPRPGSERSHLLHAPGLDEATLTVLEHHSRSLAARDADRYFEYGLALILKGAGGHLSRA